MSAGYITVRVSPLVLQALREYRAADAARVAAFAAWDADQDDAELGAQLDTATLMYQGACISLACTVHHGLATIL